jgi:hypothetical protein
MPQLITMLCRGLSARWHDDPAAAIDADIPYLSGEGRGVSPTEAQSDYAAIAVEHGFQFPGSSCSSRVAG